VQGWTGDALHANTMLSPNLTEIGAGVAQVGDRYYMVIDCALPTTGGVPQAFTPNANDTVTESFGPSDFILPIITSTPDENGLVYHEVQYGQTLWAIAIEYGVKIDDIRALNNLGATTEIYQGDRLLIRKDAPPRVPTVTFTLSTFSTESTTVAATSFPTITLIVNKTPIVSTEVPEQIAGGNSIAGIVIGITLIVLLFAGILTWIGSRKAG